MPEHAKGKPLEVWFQDEARVGQQGTLTRKWARRGTRPRAPRDTRYKWSYIFGAACPARGTAAGLIVPYVNAEAMGLHLNEIAKAVRSFFGCRVACNLSVSFSVIHEACKLGPMFPHSGAHEFQRNATHARGYKPGADR